MTITVTAYDAFGNLATGYDGVVHITSTDPQVTLPPDAALVSGVGTFLLNFDTTGTKSVTATDTVNGSLSDTAQVTVTRATSEAGAVVASAPQTYYGQDVTLTATFSANAVGDAPMTGTVSFYDGTNFLGTVPLMTPSADSPNLVIPNVEPTVTGEASLPTTALAVGDHVISAVYSGDLNYASANSETSVSVEVLHTVTTTTLSSSTTPQGTILTANVIVTSPGDPTVTGSVSFYDDSTLIGTSTISDGVATLNVGTLSSGQHQFTAVFSGGGNSSASGSSGPSLSTRRSPARSTSTSTPTATRDAGEPGLAGRVVFLDLNHDGTLDPGDPTATTDANGDFTLSGASTGSLAVLEATSQDSSDRYVVDQIVADPDGTVTIGVVPISPIAPVPVVPSPFTSSPSTNANTAFVRSLYLAVLGRNGSDSEVAGGCPSSVRG